MRIALVVPGGVGADGVHNVIPALLSLIERLARHHDLLVLATDQVGSPARYQLRGAQTRCLGDRRRGPLGRVRLAVAVLAELRSFRPDVIHVMWLGPRSTLSIVAGRILGVPVVATVGGGEMVAIRRIGYGGARSRRGRFHTRLATRFAAALTAGSRSAVAPILARRLDARSLPLGAERTSEPLAGYEAPPGELRLLVVASVNRVKGPEVVLGALARLHRNADLDVRLDWIGEDTMAGQGAALVRSLGLGGVAAFHGWEPNADVLAAMLMTDLLVQGSFHESQGVAVVEAAMRGVPTVGTAVGLVAELAAMEPPAAVARSEERRVGKECRL